MVPLAFVQGLLYLFTSARGSIDGWAKVAITRVTKDLWRLRKSDEFMCYKSDCGFCMNYGSTFRFSCRNRIAQFSACLLRISLHQLLCMYMFVLGLLLFSSPVLHVLVHVFMMERAKETHLMNIES